METLDWKQTTWDFDTLFKFARVSRRKEGILSWLKDVGVIPDDVKWRRAPMSVYNGLPRSEIKGQVLAELAYEFDNYGSGTPLEYMEWLEYEVRDSKKRKDFMSVLFKLGKD